MIPPLQLKNNMKGPTHTYISLPQRHTAVSPPRIGIQERVKSAAGSSLGLVRKGRLADELNQRDVTKCFLLCNSDAGGSFFLVPYLHRSVRQPRGRIRGSRNIVASRPPRCTVADMDAFLQVQEESGEVGRTKDMALIKCETDAISPGRGGREWLRGLENMKTIYCIAELVCVSC